ncbi:MAG: triose-phosphate isomerase, partial [Alphaproteobacteria bacterium]
MRPLIAGNWKMNKLAPDAALLAGGLAERRQGQGDPGCDILICPPSILVSRIAATLTNSSITLGGQDCHAAESGAHTGDISAAMLADAGCSYVIVGHSERRTDHDEGDALVKAKAEAALRHGLIAIVCVGETLDERDGGQAL